MRNIYPFQGQEAFNLEWTRIDETEILVVQPEIKETWQVFKVEKLPYLQAVEVVPYAYNFGFGGFLDFTNPRLDIPRNCLNIYLRSTQPSIISGIVGGNNNPTFIDETRFVTQFCTNNPGILEPPKYFVVCGCEEEKCPLGTCEVDCGDHICCYDNAGIAIAEIPLLNKL